MNNTKLTYHLQVPVVIFIGTPTSKSNEYEYVSDGSAGLKLSSALEISDPNSHTFILPYYHHHDTPSSTDKPVTSRGRHTYGCRSSRARLPHRRPLPLRALYACPFPVFHPLKTKVEY